MSPEEMAQKCFEAIDYNIRYSGQRIAHVKLAVTGTRPKGFPRGTFVCEGIQGMKIYDFDAVKILKFLVENSKKDSSDDN